MIQERPEVALLLEGAATAVDPHRASRIERLIRADIDWPYLLELARGHGVTPLVYRSVSAAKPDGVPAAILDELRQRFYANAGRNLLLAEQLLAILDALDARGIRGIPYKGPTLSAAAYGDLVSREFGDLDILVRDRDYVEAQHVLAALGYQVAKEFEWESTLVHESGICAVDLHKRIVQRGFPCPLTFEHLSPRLRKTDLCGHEIAALCPSDTLLMLAIQITKDTGTDYFQLSKICDLAGVFRSNAGLDPAEVLAEARALRNERMLLFSLRLAQDVLGIPLPPEVSRAMRSHPMIDGLVEYARGRLFESDDAAAGPALTPERFRWAIRERLRDKLHPYYHQYVVKAIEPSEADRRFLNLPVRLSFLYYLVRPLRVICKLGRGRRDLPATAAERTIARGSIHGQHTRAEGE
jgi:hypothetical protein